MQCLSTSCVGEDELSFIFQILAVLSPEPEANKSVVGFQAQINTSDSCPRKTVDLLAGISTPVSSSRPSLGLASRKVAGEINRIKLRIMNC